MKSLLHSPENQRPRAEGILRAPVRHVAGEAGPHTIKTYVKMEVGHGLDMSQNPDFTSNSWRFPNKTSHDRTRTPLDTRKRMATEPCNRFTDLSSTRVPVSHTGCSRTEA